MQEKADILADLASERWVAAMEKKGKTVTAEGRKRHRDATRALILWKLESTKDAGTKTS